MSLNKKIFSFLGLAVYSAVLFLLLAFYRLPADKLIAATVEGLTNGRLLLNTEEVSPALPISYKLKKVSYGILLRDILTKDRLDSLALGPDYGKLFRGYLPIEFEGVLPRGSIHGKTGISIRSGLEDGYLIIKASEVYLEDLNILRSLSNRDVRGKLRGEVDVEGHLIYPSKTKGKGRFYVEKGSIDTKIDLPGMKTVSFESIMVSFSIREGLVAFNNGKMDGPMFSGVFSGEIKLKNNIAKSRLKITAKMKLGPLLANNQLVSQFFARLGKGKDTVIIKIQGTLEKPSLMWSKS